MTSAEIRVRKDELSQALFDVKFQDLTSAGSAQVVMLIAAEIMALRGVAQPLQLPFQLSP